MDGRSGGQATSGLQMGWWRRRGPATREPPLRRPGRRAGDSRPSRGHGRVTAAHGTLRGWRRRRYKLRGAQGRLHSRWRRGKEEEERQEQAMVLADPANPVSLEEPSTWQSAAVRPVNETTVEETGLRVCRGPRYTV
ncbi:hypothetical protein E2C01_036689 [Portunus trituberculatus]|uniref:Uncharacterized protein n=1 Tax=Portunus trituberculatus TaxID=210409 RepID=A0A5B7FD55_PORTR|nr:hypothetical protein [Portunus trituberculatus]